MTWAAPPARARSAFSAELTVAITVGPGPGGELHGIVPDRAGAAGDQHVAPLHRAGHEHAAMRRHAGDAQRRALGERDMVGQRRHQVGVERDVFRRGAHPAAVALAVVEPDALADPAVRHAGAHPVDRPRPIAVRDHTRVLGGDRAGAAIGVGGVDPGGLQPHPHFPGAGFGGWQLAGDDDLARRSLPVVPDCPHRALPLNWRTA